MDGQRCCEAPFDPAPVVPPNHVMISIIWPGDLGWSAIIATRDWTQILAKASTGRSGWNRSWRAVTQEIGSGYQSTLDKLGAEHGHNFALMAGIAACLDPTIGPALRKVVKELLERPSRSARVIITKVDGIDRVAVMVAQGRDAGVLQ